MSYTTHESLEEIMSTLKHSFPRLEKLLQDNPGLDGVVEALYPSVEMIGSLIAKYKRGEIIEKIPPVNDK